jgi:hypothetical protein
MATDYKIGVSIALANNVSPVLGIIMRDLAGLGRRIDQIGTGFGGWSKALGGVAAVLGGTAMIGGLIALAKHGGDVNHQLELMKIAGMDNADIQGSIAQAMKTTGNVMTTTLSENLQHIRELRYAFGETSTAMEHLDEISKANQILNSIKGGGKDQVWELVKSLEQKGLTYKPEEFSSYVNTMTKVIEATGGKVTPEMFMSTFKYGRTAMLGWDEGFVGGALPRLMQSMSSGGAGGGSGTGGPGNALMSAFAKVVQGQMPKKAAAEWERMGLTPGGVTPIEGGDTSLVGDIASKDLFMKNPYEWVQKTLMPALAAKGITEQNAVIEQISKMFPVRTAAQVITEMGLQGRFHEGMTSPFEKDIRLQQGAMGQAGFEELVKNDYPTVLKAFNEQWTNLLQTIGSPMMQPGGPVMTAMAGLTNTMNSMSQFAAANPEAIKIMAYGVAALAAAFIAIPVGLLLGIPAGITAIGVAIGAIAYLEWEKIRGYLLAFNDAITRFINWLGGIADKVRGLFAGLNMGWGPARDETGHIKNPGLLDKYIWGEPGGKGGGKGGGDVDQFKKDLEDAGKNYVPMRFDPGTSRPKLTQTAFSFNVDGRTLAQTVIEQMESLTEHATGSPNYNGQSHFARADGGIMTG